MFHVLFIHAHGIDGHVIIVPSGAVKDRACVLV